jgi:putative transposase
MTRSAKGNIEEPGKNVKAKSGLNRSLLDLAGSSFYAMLEYKADWYGREYCQVDPKYTSQTCSNCGYKDKENRKTQALFKCVSCGLEMNADHNAAKNILGRAYPSGVINGVTCEPEKHQLYSLN